MENRTADIIQETRKLQIRRKASGSSAQDQSTDTLAPNTFSQIQTDQETQLKASRDVKWQLCITGLCRKKFCICPSGLFHQIMCHTNLIFQTLYDLLKISNLQLHACVTWK